MGDLDSHIVFFDIYSLYVIASEISAIDKRPRHPSQSILLWYSIYIRFWHVVSNRFRLDKHCSDTSRLRDISSNQDIDRKLIGISHVIQLITVIAAIHRGSFSATSILIEVLDTYH